MVLGPRLFRGDPIGKIPQVLFIRHAVSNCFLGMEPSAVLISFWGRGLMTAIRLLPPLPGYTTSPLLVPTAAAASPNSGGAGAVAGNSSAAVSDGLKINKPSARCS